MKEKVTAEEAWKIAEKIVLPNSLEGYDSETLIDILNTSGYVEIFQNTPQQAKEAIEKWQKNIYVGDIVKRYDEEVGVVVGKNPDDVVFILYSDGSYSEELVSECVKTGGYIDISEFLEQIRGEE